MDLNSLDMNSISSLINGLAGGNDDGENNFGNIDKIAGLLNNSGLGSGSRFPLLLIIVLLLLFSNRNNGCNNNGCQQCCYRCYGKKHKKHRRCCCECCRCDGGNCGCGGCGNCGNGGGCGNGGCGIFIILILLIYFLNGKKCDLSSINNIFKSTEEEKGQEPEVEIIETNEEE